MDGIPSQVASYRIDGEIRRGPIATVYRAFDTLYDRSVALKIVAPYFAQNVEFVRRFIAGGRDAMQLRHPHIAQVYEAGQADGLSFVAMELATGGTLADVLADWKGPAPAGQVLIRVRQIALALEYAHSLGFVHGNLKPSNILFDEHGEVKLTDFGPIGQEGSLRLTGGPFGYPLSSPVFFSPEQASGEGSVDGTTDIYALGIISYRLLCGVFPFDGANPLIMLRRVIEEEPPPPDAINPAIESHVASAIRAALSKDPSLRPRSAAAFMDGIDGRVTAYASSYSPPPAPAYTPRPPVRTPPVYSPPAQPVRQPAMPPAPVPQARGTSVSTAASSATSSAFSAVPRLLKGIALPAAPRLRAASMALGSKLPGLAVGVLGALLVALILLALARSLDMFDFTRRQANTVATTPAGLVILPTPTPSPRPVNVAVRSSAPRGPVTAPKPTASPRPQATEATESPAPTATSTRRTAESVASAATSPSVQRTLPAARIVSTRESPTATPSPVPTATASWTPTHTPEPTATPLPSPTFTPPPAPTPTPIAEIANSPEFVAALIPERSVQEPNSVQPAAPTPTSSAPLPPLTGRIAYSLWNPRTVRPDLYIWHVQTGINSQPIPDRHQPDFNLYNQLVANAEGNGMDNLVKMGTYGEDPWIISEHPEDAHPHWSPDGKMVVFDSAHMGDRNHRIYLQRDTDRRSELPPMMYEAWELFGRYPIFLADGRVAYNGCNWWENGSVCGIYVVDIHGGQPTAASAWPGDIPTDNLGTDILFMADRGGNWDIYRMASDGSNVRRLTDSPSVESHATASPDGAHIAFLTNRDGVWAIHAMQSDGSNRRELVKLNGGFGSGEYDWLQERLSWGY